jgi:hypothetical protein
MRCPDCGIQGGVINSKQFFSGLSLLLLGCCEQQDEQNLLGGGPSNGVNLAAGMGGPPVAMEMAYCQITALSSVLNRTM